MPNFAVGHYYTKRPFEEGVVVHLHHRNDMLLHRHLAHLAVSSLASTHFAMIARIGNKTLLHCHLALATVASLLRRCVAMGTDMGDTAFHHRSFRAARAFARLHRSHVAFRANMGGCVHLLRSCLGNSERNSHYGESEKGY